jgi:hypothetical protein
MTLDMIRRICLALPDATEDVKWGQDRSSARPKASLS